MGFLYRSVKRGWRAFVPTRWNSAVFGGRGPFSRAILAAKGWLEAKATDDEMYDREYYRRQDVRMRASASHIAESLTRRLEVHSVIDVGCGSGAVLSQFKERGIPGIGLEKSRAAIELCRSKGLDVRPFDLTSDAPVNEAKADLVLCTEVAEHLPAEFADSFVSTLVQMARCYVLITAATPGQGGTHHVNEQPYEYWIEKFKGRGAEYLEPLTGELREEWRRLGVDRSRARNTLVFSVKSHS